MVCFPLFPRYNFTLFFISSQHSSSSSSSFKFCLNLHTQKKKLEIKFSKLYVKKNEKEKKWNKKRWKALKIMGSEPIGGFWRSFRQMGPYGQRHEIIESTNTLLKQKWGFWFWKATYIHICIYIYLYVYMYLYIYISPWWSSTRAGGPRGTAGKGWPGHVGIGGPKGSTAVLYAPRVL